LLLHTRLMFGILIVLRILVSELLCSSLDLLNYEMYEFLSSGPQLDRNWSIFPLFYLQSGWTWLSENIEKSTDKFQLKNVATEPIGWFVLCPTHEFTSAKYSESFINTIKSLIPFSRILIQMRNMHGCFQKCRLYHGKLKLKISTRISIRCSV